MYGYSGDFLFDYDVGFLKPLSQVPQPELKSVGYVGALFSVVVGTNAPGSRGGVVQISQPLVDQGSIFFHRLLGAEHRGQDLILDMDERQGFLGNMGVVCRHPCHGVSLVEHLVPGQDVIAHETGIDHETFSLVCDITRGLGHIIRSNHGFNAGMGLGPAGVNGLDARVGMWATQHHAVQHPRKANVGAIAGTARHFISAVLANGPGAHDLVFLLGEDDVGLAIKHALPSHLIWGKLAYVICEIYYHSMGATPGGQNGRSG